MEYIEFIKAFIVILIGMVGIVACLFFAHYISSLSRGIIKGFDRRKKNIKVKIERRCRKRWER